MEFKPENTLANATFDILSASDYNIPVDPLININKLATIDLHEGHYTMMAFAFMEATDNLITDAKFKLYGAINESGGNATIIHESFSDFFASIKEIIDKFIKWIKSLFAKFVNNFNKLIGSDSYLKKHLDALKSFDSSMDFRVMGFEYTFAPNVPNPNVVIDGWSASFFDEFYNKQNSNVGIFNGGNNPFTAINSNFDMDSKMDKWRAMILGRAGEVIYSSEYSEECFMEFRNGSLDSEYVDVDGSYIIAAIRRFKDYSDTKKTIEKQSKDIEKAYNDARKKIEEFSKDKTKTWVDADSSFSMGEYTKIASPSERLNGMDNYIKLKCDELTNITNAHALAFAAKLDAVTECYKQDKAILYTALNKVAKKNA